MSLHAMAWARSVKAPLTSTEAFVLEQLADFADDHGGNCFPEMSTIARRCRISRATVFRVLDRLEHVHHVIRKERSGARKGRANRYRLLIDAAPILPNEVPDGSPIDPVIAPVPNLFDPEGVSHGETPHYPQGVASDATPGCITTRHPGVSPRDRGVASDATGGVASGDTPHTPQYPSLSPSACAGGHVDRYGDPVSCGARVEGCTAFVIDEATRDAGRAHVAQIRDQLAARAGTGQAANGGDGR